MENFELRNYVKHPIHGYGQIIGIDPDCGYQDLKYLCAFADSSSNSLDESCITAYKRMGIILDESLCRACLGCKVGWAHGTHLTLVSPEIFASYSISKELAKRYTTDKKEDKPVFVRRFASGAIRSDDRGREKPSFVSPYAITEIAKHFSKNASFFNGNDSGKNYMKGIKPEDIQDSLERHVLEFKENMMPFKYDRDKVKQNLVEIAANCVMALHQIVMEEKGEYVEKFEGTEYIERDKAYDQ